MTHVPTVSSELRHPVVAGIILAVAVAFPLAEFVGLVYRFPIPFVGFRSGFEAVGLSAQAVLVYTIFVGGWVVFIVFGIVAAAIARSIGSNRKYDVIRLVSLVTVFDLIAILLLAMFG